MSGVLRSGVCAVVVAVAMLDAGCATTTTFRAPAAAGTDARLEVEDHEVGRIPAGGADVEVDAGVAPVRWRVLEGGVVLGEGTVERSQVQWGVVIGAGLAAACCIPTAAATGFCLANPALIASPLACIAGNPGVCVTACQAPGWSSIPLTAVGAGIGASPLAFGLLGAHLPPEVILDTAAATPTTPTPPTPAAPPAAPTTPAPASATAAPPPASTSTTPEGMWF